MYPDNPKREMRLKTLAAQMHVQFQTMVNASGHIVKLVNIVDEKLKLFSKTLKEISQIIDVEKNEILVK